MTLRQLIVQCFAVSLCLAALGGCGGEMDDDERAALLAKDPLGTFKTHCDTFLAEVAKETAWSAVAAPKRPIEPTSETFGNIGEKDGHLGFLLVTLADKDKKETRFRFVFTSKSSYGTWLLRQIHAKEGASGKYDTYMGDRDALYDIGSRLGGYGG